VSERLFQAPATVMGVRTLADRTVKLDVAVQELPAEEMAMLFGLTHKLGWVLFKETEIAEADIPTIKLDQVMGETKSPGQRLHNVLFVYWRDNTGQKEPFEVFYRWEMDRVIQRYKEALL
jgi:hypothetical protein